MGSNSKWEDCLIKDAPSLTRWMAFNVNFLKYMIDLDYKHNNYIDSKIL